MLPVTDVEFPGHAEHMSMEVAFVEVKYVFTGQEVHSADPIVSLYLPSWHAEHGGVGGPKICHSIIVK
jgi:hypothetical protein